MGMYTEIYINVDLKPDVPDSVLNVLKAMCGDDTKQLELSTYPKRWGYLFNCGSYYTPNTECASLTYDSVNKFWSLLGKGDIKNYESEIETFFAWIMPRVDAEEGEFIGYKRYEEEQLPTLITKVGIVNA
jgi:hypothetical protein